MICENYATNQPIVDAIIWYHRNNALPVSTPAGMQINNGLLDIDYGYKGTKYGIIAIKRGQFEVTKVSDATGALKPLGNYNHAGKNQRLQDYVDALKNNNLNTNQKNASALIILTSESCRSQMVSNAMSGILHTENAFSDDVWGGLHFAFTKYGSTSRYLGHDIQAGGTPWSWLKANDYLKYIASSGFTGDKPKESGYINKVSDYNTANTPV